MGPKRAVPRRSWCPSGPGPVLAQVGMLETSPCGGAVGEDLGSSSVGPDPKRHVHPAAHLFLQVVEVEPGVDGVAERVDLVLAAAAAYV